MNLQQARSQVRAERTIPRIAPSVREHIDRVLAYGFHNTTSVGVAAEMERGFAEKFDSRYAILHSNGTTTMHSALIASGVGPGDEVIVPPLTAAATGLVVLHANAIPVFADIDPETYTIDPDDIRRKLSSRTRAIIPVSIYGLPPDLDEIMEIASEHDLKVIEDNAQCYLSTYRGRMAGSIGHFASYSFQASKHMTCGDGGILICSDPDLADGARKASSFGYASATALPGESVMPEEHRCRPDAVRHVTWGFNFRMPEIAAAVTLGELERLELLVAMRIESAMLFDQVVRDCSWLAPPMVPEDRTHSFWTYVCRIDRDGPDWNELRSRFVEAGGDGFYGAWLPTYREPVLKELSAAVETQPERYPHLAGVMPDYREVSCPVLEDVQPRLMQIKTNYFDLDEAARQADILAGTLRSFS